MDKVKITLEMPVALAKRAKIEAVKQGTTLRALIIEGLDARLKKGGS